MQNAVRMQGELRAAVAMRQMGADELTATRTNWHQLAQISANWSGE
jgi:hypothetical protein